MTDTSRNIQKAPDYLSLKDKAKAAMKGLLKGEPLLELASLGVSSGLPRAERLKHVAKLANSGSTERIGSHLCDEKDPAVANALALAYVEAYHRRLGSMQGSLYSRTSAMAARNTAADIESYKSEVRFQAWALNTVIDLSPGAQSALNTIIEGRGHS